MKSGTDKKELLAFEKAPEFDDNDPEFSGGRPVTKRERLRIERTLRGKSARPPKKKTLLQRLFG